MSSFPPSPNKKTMKHPFEPRIIDVKSGWKNNAQLIYRITEYVNENYGVDKEDEFSEQVDYVLEYLKNNFTITKQETKQETK